MKIDDMQEILEDFLIKGFEIVESLIQNLDTLKKEPTNPKPLSLLYYHTSLLGKYSSFLGYHNLFLFIQRLTQTITTLQHNPTQITPATLNTLLKTVHSLKLFLIHIRDHQNDHISLPKSSTPPCKEEKTPSNVQYFMGLKLDEEELALPLENIQEVIFPISHTPLPQTPPYVLGAFSFKNKIIPLINLRERLGYAPKENALKTKVVILEYQNNTFGLFVEQITEIFSLQKIDRKENKTPNIYGVGKKEESEVYILDLKSLFEKLM